MQASSYENTLAFVHALNRKSRKPSMLQHAVRLFGALADGVRAANAYDDLTRQGVAPEKAVRLVFEAIRR